jgi:cytochrome P450
MVALMIPQLTSVHRQFESGVKWLTMGMFPSLTAAGPARARRRLIHAFMEFVEDNPIANGETCDFIRQLGEVASRHNRGVEYLTRYFLGVFCAFIINTVPVTFWTIGYIVENRSLLARIRTELAEVVEPTARVEGIGELRLSLNITAVRERCPLLVSAFSEVLRCVGASISTLALHEDVWIDDRYLLTKGALVQISATAIHTDPDVWGPNAADFDPERFLKPRKIHPSANRTFGGGCSLCPGRHLASDEILAFTAMLLYTFDIEFTEDTPHLPRRDDTDMLSIMKPTNDLALRLSRRQGMEKVWWSILR